MLLNKKIIGIGVLVIAIFFSITVAAQYVPTNKDTKLPPDKINPDFLITDTTNFVELYENENYIYYFKESRDVLAIYDKRNEYLWKTGIDSASQEEGENACFDKPKKVRKEEGCDPVNFDLNFKFAAFANSLLSIEYFDNTRQIIKQPSSIVDPYKTVQDVTSTLQKVDGVEDHYILNVSYLVPNIQIKLHIHFDANGVNYEVRDEEITGADQNNLASILVAPFTGASGGKLLGYDKVEDDFVIDLTYRVPGYILVPDGSGALIRFADLSTSRPLTSYAGAVYGKDYSQIELSYRTQFRYAEIKQPVMPVYGIAHGNDEAAFIAYSTDGADHMEIIASPDGSENMNYHFAYPRYVFNNKYYQVYNKQGQNFEKIRDERNHYNINIKYEFLAGDGSTDGLPANYVGMAKAYRNHLIKENVISLLNYTYDHVPTRIDFIMADAKKTIVGYEDVVVTNINDVETILKDLNNTGVVNINSGLIGYQKGGATLAKPSDIRYNSSIGSKADFKEVIANLKALGIDVSLQQDFVKINEEQMSLTGNAIKHASNWYTTFNLYDAEATVHSFNYARVEKTAKWVNSYLKDLKALNTESLTVDGIQNILLSDYSKDLITRAEAIEINQKTLSKINENYKINAVNPNQYTWQYIDRYLNSPVFNSQFIIQTDTVPFLQMVLNGTMELYAPYSNFSFYTDSDVLRMIDYNVYPSFILSQEPAYLLMATNSANFYSTEYIQYKDLIQSIYGRVDGALKNVINREWIDRTVVQDGVIVNAYGSGNTVELEIVVNYTNDEVEYNGVKVQPKNYQIIEKE